MIIRTVFLLGFSLALWSCTEKLICPAYQSSFIYDKETLRKKFSYFQNDSTPKVYTASKTKYLIAVPESYRKRYRKMQTVQMKPVYPVVLKDSVAKKDSVSVFLDSLRALGSGALTGLDSATRMKLDSAQLSHEDSVYVITTAKEKFNIEQENYMWFFRKELILPDVRLAKLKEAEKGKDKDKEKEAEVVKKKGFFRKLMFWKKDKKPKPDSLKIAPGSLSPDSLAMADSLGTVAPSVKPKKKGILGIFKKKSKAEPSKQPAKKEEDDESF